MSQFAKLGTGGTIGFSLPPSDNTSLAQLKRITMPHRYQEHNNVYGINSIEKLARDQAVDKRLWPEYNVPGIMAASISRDKDRIHHMAVKHFEQLIQTMIERYVANAVEKGAMYSFEYVTKKTPMFDISRAYKSDELERFSFPYLYLYEEEVDHLRSYGWEAFFPCLNRFTIRANNQRYVHVEVLDADPLRRSFTLRIQDYAGNRFAWIKEQETTAVFVFSSTDPETGLLSMADNDVETEGYEQFLMSHVQDMGWDKRQTRFWMDAFGIERMDNMVFVKLTPTREFLEDDGLPEDAKHDVTLMLYDKKNMPLLQKANGMRISIEHEGDEAMAIYRAQVYSALRMSYLKLMSAINLELACEPDAEARLSAPDMKQCVLGRMTVTSDGPVPVRIPHLERTKPKEGNTT